MTAAIEWCRPVGVLVVLELRQRTRASRWRVTLAAAFVAVSLVVFGSMYYVLTTDSGGPGSGYRNWSTQLYTIVYCFVGLIGLVVAPTLTATSINGDRKDLTLAPVQATPISARQLALGKLLGGWLASLTLLVTALPYLIWGIVVAPNPWGCAAGVAVLVVLLGCYSGIGLGLSAVTARPLGSAVLTQLTVIFLLLGLPVVAAVLVPATSTTVTATRADWSYTGGNTSTCTERPRTVRVERTNRIWWVLAPNPVVTAGDAIGASDRRAGPSMPRRYTDYESSEAGWRPPQTWFGVLAEAVAEFRVGPDAAQDTSCAGGPSGYGTHTDAERADAVVGHTWYWGLAANLVLGAAGTAFAMRRLRVPAGRLPRGVRIA